MARSKKKSAQKASEPSFEELLGRLEELVEELEEGDLSLAGSLAAFEEGVRLSRLGQAHLDAAERRIEELLDPPGAEEEPRPAGESEQLALDP